MHTCGTCGMTMVETTGGCATCATAAPSPFPSFVPSTTPGNAAATGTAPWSPPIAPMMAPPAAPQLPSPQHPAPQSSTSGAPIPEWGAVPSAHWNADHADMWGPPAEVEWGPEVLHAHIAPPKPLHKRGGAGTAIGIGIAVLAIAASIVLGIMFLGDLEEREGSGSEAARFTEMIEGDWTSHTTSSGVFTLDLPGTPERQSIDVPTEMGDFQTEMIYSGPGSVDSAEQGILAMNADYGSVVPDAQLVANFDSVLGGVANGALQKNGGELVGTERVESPIGPAGQFTGRYAERGLFMHGFITFRGTDMIAIMVIVDDADQDIGKLTLARAVASLTAT